MALTAKKVSLTFHGLYFVAKELCEIKIEGSSIKTASPVNMTIKNDFKHVQHNAIYVYPK